MTEDYYSMHPIKDGVNWSFLKMGLNRSWHHAYEAYVLGMQAPPSPSMKRGTLIHTLVLEPIEFDNRYAVAPEINRRTKAGKEAWAEFVEQSAGKDVITMDEYDEAMACQMQVLTHPWMSRVLDDPRVKFEAMVRGESPPTQYYGRTVPCRAKLDVLVDTELSAIELNENTVDRGTFVLDLKTTTDASEDAFRRSIYRYQYHAQLAFYADLAGVSTAYIVAVETSGSHQVAVYELSHHTLEEGRKIYQEALDQFVQCLSFYNELGTDAFGSYPSTPITI